jgi:hypothetical protein
MGALELLYLTRTARVVCVPCDVAADTVPSTYASLGSIAVCAHRQRQFCLQKRSAKRYRLGLPPARGGFRFNLALNGTYGALTRWVGCRHKLLRLLTAFAVGGLLGDVFLHILPHIATGHGHDSHHSDHSHIDILTGVENDCRRRPPPLPRLQSFSSLCIYCPRDKPVSMHVSCASAKRALRCGF